jgi:hypothetical protein
MANLSGGKYITFEKPYLEMLAEKIDAGDDVKFDGNVSQKVNKTKDVKKFLTAVKNKNEINVASVLKIGSSFSPLFNGYRWTEIDKGQFTKKGGSDGQSTAQQERASLYAIQVGIENNGYTDQKKFMQLYREDLRELYPAMNEEWENTFFQQQLTTYRQVGNTKYKHYSRDGGFMDYISALCKSMYGISQKDTWNPADIWLVSDLSAVKRQLDKAVKDNTTSLQEFNAILRDMFHERKIIGISLKLMSGKTAKWELVNLENADMFDDDTYTFEYDSAELNLKMKTAKEFINTDSKITMKGKTQTIKFQIRQNSAGFNNLKIEGTDVGSSAARLGKVPLDMASSVFSGAGLESSRWRNHRNYPKTAEEYASEQRTHEARFTKLKATNKVNLGGVSTAKQFSENMIAVYSEGKADIAMSKLMQLDLLNEIFSLRGKKLDNFLTGLAFLAQKKGSVFGPFAKLY